MKRIFKLSFLALFMVVASCEDATDIVQESELNDEAAFRDINDLRSGLFGVYNAYGPDFASNGNGDAFLFNDLFTDNLRRGPDNLGQGSQEYSFSIQPNSQVPTSIWGNRYSTINFSNRVLRALDRLYPGLSEADKLEADRIKGHCLAMRALCHFDLLSYFATDYENDNAPGVIIMNFVPEIDQQFPRNTVGEVLSFINSDLVASSVLLEQFPVPLPGIPLVNQNYPEPFFVNKDVVKAIRARVALFEGNYTLAETLSIELLDDYPLSSQGEYFNIWDQGQVENTEVIFALSRLINDPGVAANWYANRVDIEGSPFLQASVQLYNLYNANDIRKDVFFDDSGDLQGAGELGLIADGSHTILIGKYQGGGAGQLVQHVPIFRSSEMLLIKAEAEARANNFVAAAESVRQLRAQRRIDETIPVPVITYSTVQEALADILLERRKEFAFEGHRYLDLKRLGVDAGVTTLTRDDADCTSFSAPCDLSLTDYRFTLPIPTSEISANPSIQQNPGYTN